MQTKPATTPASLAATAVWRPALTQQVAGKTRSTAIGGMSRRKFRTERAAPNETRIYADQPPTRLLAGALAHLARHMETGCPQAANLAAILLVRIADDPEADPHLREHAQELVEILERERVRASWPAASATAVERTVFVRLRALRSESALCTEPF